MDRATITPNEIESAGYGLRTVSPDDALPSPAVPPLRRAEQLGDTTLSVRAPGGGMKAAIGQSPYWLVAAPYPILPKRPRRYGRASCVAGSLYLRICGVDSTARTPIADNPGTGSTAIMSDRLRRRVSAPRQAGNSHRREADGDHQCAVHTYAMVPMPGNSGWGGVAERAALSTHTGAADG